MTVRVDILGKVLLCVVLSAGFPVAAAEKAGDYGVNLSRIYFAHQRLLALREACDQALPAQVKAGEKAYAAWQFRHRALLNELDARLTLMIRGASKDEKEYIWELTSNEKIDELALFDRISNHEHIKSVRFNMRPIEEII